MKLKLLLFSNQKYRKNPQSIKYTPGKGGFLTLRMGMLHVLTWSLKFGVGKICLKSREGEVIRATVFLYLYELMNSVINSLMNEKGELITLGL